MDYRIAKMKHPSTFKYLPSILVLLIVCSFCLALAGNQQQFSHLANSFWHGHLYSLENPENTGDFAYFNGKYYWPLGPLPAIILLPFVFLANSIGVFFYQAYLQIFLVLGVLGLVFLIAKNRFLYSLEDSLFLAFGFVLGSAFIGVAAVGFSWYFAHVVAVFLSFWALYEFYGKKRWWLIGSICAGLLLTRLGASLIIIFFGLEIFQSKLKKSKIRTSTMALFIPFFVAILMLGFYNQARFGNFFDQGYSYSVLPKFYSTVRGQGLFSIRHIPTNFFYAFLSGPVPVHAKDSYSLVFPFIKNNPLGMSIFITSPYLLYLFTLKRSEFKARDMRLLAAIAVIAIFVLAWFANGWFQFAYRFSFDFLPLLFVLFMIKYRQKNKRLSTGMKSLLIGSGFLNFYMLVSFIGQIVK